MSDNYIYISILLMATVPYLIREVPLLVLRKPIKNKVFRSFLYYAPYVTLAVLTFPSILYSTGSFASALAGTVVAVIASFFKLGLPITAAAGCVTALLFQLFL